MAITRLTLASLLLIAVMLLSTETSAQPAAPTPGRAGPINLTAILEKSGQCNTFIHLLNITQVGSQVNIQVNSSSEGMTVFAPTDNAFQKLKPGTLNKLSADEQVKLILYHISPRFYTLDDLLFVGSPIRTQASGRDNGVYGLNFTGQANQINVSTGYVETRVNNALRQQRPLAVYVVDMVLLPGEMFREHKLSPIAPAPKSPSTGVFDDFNSTKKVAASPIAPVLKSPSTGVFDDSNFTKKVAASPADKSGSSERKVGLGLGLGLVVFCLKFLF